MTGFPQIVRDIVRRHHVHYDVVTHPARDAPGETNDVLLRLWAVHQRGAGALPGCAKCRMLLTDLRSLARLALAELPAIEQPSRLALYDSTVVPGADEVSLELRITDGVAASGHDVGPRSVVKRARAILQAIGIPER